MAQFLGAVGEVIGIDPDTVPADQAGREGQEIPLGFGGGEHVPHRQIHPSEDLRDLVHEGDIDVALGVLDDLGGFGGLDRGGAERAPAGHRAVEIGDPIERFGVLPGNDLGDLVDRMLAIARIDPLGTVAEQEIRAASLARMAFEDRSANVFGHARIDGAFIDDDRGLARRDGAGQHRGHGSAGRFDQREVGPALGIDRRGYGDDVEIARRTIRCLIRQRQRAGAQPLALDFAGAVVPIAQFGNAPRVDIEAGGAKMPGQRDGQRQPDIA